MPKMSLEFGDAELSDSETDEGIIKYMLTMPVINKGNMPSRYRVNVSSELSDGSKTSQISRGFVRRGQTRNIRLFFEHEAKDGRDIHTVELSSFILGPIGSTLEQAKVFAVDIYKPIFGTGEPFAVVRRPTGIEEAVKVRFEGDP